jgi:hypothetical protein
VTLNDTEMFETANEAVLFCHSYLLEKGEAAAAVYLEGLDCISDLRGARIAYNRLVAAEQRTVSQAVRYAVTSALRAVERTLDASAPRLHAVA